MRRLFRQLVSRQVAIALMLAIAFFLALASLVPEADLSPERLAELRRSRPVAAFLVRTLRPDRTVRSPVFVGLAGWVFLSTAWSIVERVRAEVKRRRRRGEAALERFQALEAFEAPVAPEEALAAARRELRRRRYRVVEADGTAALVATRGAAGFGGSIAFHAGLLVCMVGVAASALTRVNGEVLLVEGFPVRVEPGTVMRATRPEALGPLAGTVLEVSDFTAQYDRGFSPVDFAARFEARRRGREAVVQVARVNQGIWVDGFQLTLHRYGFAPDLAIAGEGGGALAEGTAVLRVLPPGTEDGLALEDGSELRIALYPDYAERLGEPVTRSLYPIDPVIAVRHLDRGAEVARGLVRRGEEARVGRLRIAFRGLRYWADFQLGRDGGLPWIAVGSALVALGLALRFVIDPQALRLTAAAIPGGCRIELRSSARYFPALNEERARRLRDRLEGVLGAARREAA